MALQARFRDHRLEGPRPARARELPLLSVAALVLALAAAASAGESKLAKPAGLHPLLLGDPAYALNPVRGALERQVAEIKTFAVAGYVPQYQAENVLLDRSFQGATQNAAALIAAKLAVDRAAADAFFATRPELESGPVGELPHLILPDHPYRGGVGAPDTILGQFAHAATVNPTVSWLFDGSKPETRFEDVRMPKNAGKGKITYRPHPYIDGAGLLVAPKGQVYPSLGRRREIARRLAEAGVGPRVLASGPIHQGEAVALETVYGRTVRDHIAAGSFTPYEHGLVLDMLARMARGRVSVEPLDPGDIVIGHTLSDPALKAYIVRPGELTDLSHMSEGAAYESLLWQPAFAGLKFAAPDEILGQTEIQYLPLGQLLGSQVRDPQTKLLQRVLKKIGL